MAPLQLPQVARIIYGYHFAKFLIGAVRPEILQEHTDFCHGCDVSSDAGFVTSQYEAFHNFFLGLIFVAVAQYDSERSIRTVICWAKVLPLCKLAVIAKLGQATLTEGHEFGVSVVENLALLALECVTCHVWYKKPSSGGRKGKFEIYDNRTAVRLGALEVKCILWN